MLTGLHTALVRRALLPLRERRRGHATFHRLRSLLASQWWPPERIRDVQLLRLRALVARAAEAPYYRDRLREASVRPEDLRQMDDLAALPLLEKAVLRERPDALSPGGLAGGTRRRRTSGSTGVPVEVWVPAETRQAIRARLWRLGTWWDTWPWDRKLVLLARRDRARVDRWRDALLQNLVEHAATDLSEVRLAALARDLRRGVRVLEGYPSSLAVLAHYLLDRGLPPPPALRAVFVTGETLHPDQRRLMARAFGAPVVNTYGCSEVGLIAGACKAGRLHLAAEDLIVEFLPVPGAGGLAEVVVTDLTNHVMPLLRYRLGDLGLAGTPCPCGRTLPVVDLRAGRVAELVLLPDGRRADFTVVSRPIDELVAEGLRLHQYRVVQHAKDLVEVQVVAPGEERRVVDLLPGRLRRALGPGLVVKVQVLDAIPPDPSGKLRRFISCLAPGPSDG